MQVILRNTFFICIALALFGFDHSYRPDFDEPDNGLQDFLDNNPELVIVDEERASSPYTKGEAIFRGRGKTPKLSYCIQHQGKLLKIKRRTMRHYKHSISHEFANQLYTCDDSDQKIINLLSRDDFIHLMYYLNEKYKLYLKRE